MIEQFKKCCPACGSVLISAYQKKPPEDAYYIVFCSKFDDCTMNSTNLSGKGETEQAAISDYVTKLKSSNRWKQMNLASGQTEK